MEEYYQQNPVFETASTQSALAQGQAQAAQAQAMQYQVEEQEKGLAEAQLECEKTLEKAYHLLKQDVLRPGPDGLLDWQPLKDQKQRVLTDVGVDKIMQTLSMYINKETLLSNFNEQQINTRMLKFCLALNSNIFMKYEIYFRLPTLQECKDILKQRMEEKLQIKRLAAELAGKSIDEEQINKEIVNEIEKNLEKEMQKIKAEQIKINLREIELLFTQLEALVEATHNRAFRGEERGSLRRHLNISEVIGSNQQQQKQGGLFGWGRR